MKRFFKPCLLLMAAATLLSSCLKSTDDETVYNDDTAIITFSVGTLKQQVVGKDRQGNDSLYWADKNCSGYKFLIDQAGRQIYNADSLPYGIDPTRVVCTVMAKNAGVVYRMNAADGSQTLYSAKDTFDLSGPQVFRVYSQRGDIYRDYTVKLNIHQQIGDEFKWGRLTTNSVIGALQGMKAVELGHTVYLFGSNGSQTKVMTTDRNDGKNWVSQTITLDAGAWQNVAVKDGLLFVLDGTTLRQYNGTTWSVTNSSTPISRLIGASESRLYGYNAGGQMLGSADNGKTWTAETTDNASHALPGSNVNFIVTPLITNDNISQLLLIGNEGTGAGSAVTIWGKIEEQQTGSEQAPWNYFEVSSSRQHLLPPMQSLQVVCFQGTLIALGGDRLDTATDEGFTAFYTSVDKGISWKTDAKTYLVPDGFSSASNAFTMLLDSDNFLWLICGESGQVWKGRQNRMGWTENQKVFNE